MPAFVCRPRETKEHTRTWLGVRLASLVRWCEGCALADVLGGSGLGWERERLGKPNRKGLGVEHGGLHIVVVGGVRNRRCAAGWELVGEERFGKPRREVFCIEHILLNYI